MTIHGWRQLIEWSIEHSCMEDKLRSDIYTDWERRWNVFCEWIVKEYGYLAEGVTLEEAQK
jgi:adenosine deaminase CECR1